MAWRTWAISHRSGLIRDEKMTVTELFLPAWQEVATQVDDMADSIGHGLAIESAGDMAIAVACDVSVHKAYPGTSKYKFLIGSHVTF